MAAGIALLALIAAPARAEPLLTSSQNAVLAQSRETVGRPQLYVVRYRPSPNHDSKPPLLSPDLSHGKFIANLVRTRVIIAADPTLDQPVGLVLLRALDLPMSRSSIFLLIAGCLGLLTALAHGFIMQRSLIQPLNEHLSDHRIISRVGRDLLSPLLHVSTLAWGLAGTALIYAAIDGERDTQNLASAIGIAFYLHATVANARAVRGAHPGWILMGGAALLIVAAQF
jgi:hypothetical protein